MNHLVIMAGGIGSRFWPMSTTENPKQFIDVLGVGRSLIQLTYDRFKGICAPENVWVVTGEVYAQKVHEQLPEIPEGNILSEPCRRNTAPCIAYVSYRIKAKDEKASICVTPSDHIVTDIQEFQRIIKASLQFAAESDAIVTLGMKPTRPETGYGYIQANLSAQSMSNKEIFREIEYKIHYCGKNRCAEKQIMFVVVQIYHKRKPCHENSRTESEAKIQNIESFVQ